MIKKLWERPDAMDIELVTIAIKWIAGLGITVAVGAGTAFAAFQYLGKKWLEAHFAERLEKFKHEQNQEIERLRYRINALMDRTAKLHQHEFEVLPEIWNKLGKAFSTASNFTSGLTSYPDLDQMSQAQFAEFVAASELSSWQKDELRRSSSRNENYKNMIFWHRLQTVKTSHAEFHNYFISMGIFVQSELKEKIRELSDMMYDAFHERELDEHQLFSPAARFAKREHLRREGLQRLQAIENDVQARLWDANKLD